MPSYYPYYLIFINLLTYVLMIIDKEKAKRKQIRISERSFTLWSFFGGFIGISIAGITFRHKTKKHSFQLKIFCATLIHIVSIFYLNKFLAL